MLSLSSEDRHDFPSHLILITEGNRRNSASNILQQSTTISANFFIKTLVQDHQFSTYAKFPEKLTYLTSWYAHVRHSRVYIKEQQILHEKKGSTSESAPMEASKGFDPLLSQGSCQKLKTSQKFDFGWFAKYGLFLYFSQELTKTNMILKI